jgi:hypothetical protein
MQKWRATSQSPVLLARRMTEAVRRITRPGAVRCRGREDLARNHHDRDPTAFEGETRRDLKHPREPMCTDQRSDLNAARISPAKSSGCSQAAK